ncbi:MAG: hypothetical protein Q9219_002190 [cf. Caloplaca sp. 3 TL-2023]
MSDHENFSRLHLSMILEETKMREAMQAVWDEYNQLSTVAADNNLPRSGARPMTTAAFSGEARDEDRHWTEAYTGRRVSQESSSLLSLPLEILDQIVGYVLGRQTVHVDAADTVRRLHARKCQDRRNCLVRQARHFFLRPCQAETSETDALREFRTQAVYIPPNDQAKYFVADARLRHQNCRPWEQDVFRCTNRATLSPGQQWFNLFHVCNRIALSAFRVFWTTNTFSFGQNATFSPFLARLNQKQLQAIRYIDFNINDTPQRYHFDPAQVMKLKSLDHLHITVHTMFLGFVSDMDARTPSVQQMDLRRAAGADLFRLEVLDLKRVTVIVYDNEEDFDHDEIPEDRKYELRFSLQHKRNLAALMESTLMFDAETKRVLAAKDREIFEIEEMFHMMQCSLDIRHQMQRRVLARMAEVE